MKIVTNSNYFLCSDTDLNFNFDEADSFIFEFEDIPQTQEPISQLPPINTGDTSIGIESFVENDVESFAGNDNEQSNENDVEHFPPVSDLCTGEYSYFKNIQNFYAGPTYWKYMRKRTINQSIGKAPIKRRRKEPEVPDFECYASDSSDESDEDSLFQSVDKIRKSIRTVGYRNWDSQKLLLPPPLKIPNNLFDRYTFAPSIKTDKTLSPDESFDDVANTSDELFDDDFCVMNDANDLVNKFASMAMAIVLNTNFIYRMILDTVRPVHRIQMKYSISIYRLNQRFHSNNQPSAMSSVKLQSW